MHEVNPPAQGPGERLDGWISTLFPAWGARRAAHRVAQREVERLSGFRGARALRTDRNVASRGRQDRHLEATLDRRDMVDRARQLERNSVLAEGILSRSVENVVGCGFKLQSMTSSAAWNAEAERLWSAWGAHADVRGMSSWNELLALKFRSYLRDGDVGTILLGDGSVQTFESDQLSSPSGIVLSRNMVDGIKLDDRGRPLSYFVVDSPNPIGASVRYQAHTEIPAESVLYLARRTRLGQTRGLSCFTTISWLIEQLDGNIEAVTVAARMAACYGLVITAPMPTGLPTAQGGDGRTRQQISMEPGMAKYLRPGQDVKQINPTQPGTNWPEFLRTLGRLIGMALGLPLEIAFGDYSKTNFTSGRMAMLSAWRTWRCYQVMLKDYSASVYKWKLMGWMQAGLLPVREDALSHAWHAPGWQFINPTTEINAALAAVDGGLKSYTQCAAEMGNDWVQLVEARSAELRMLDEAGLPKPARSTITRDPLPVTATITATVAPDEDDSAPDPEPEPEDEPPPEDEDEESE